VTGYPTLILIKDGMYYKYRGDRTIKGFSDFALHEDLSTVEEKDEIPRQLEGMELY
jgi:hypothetical protein